MIAIDTNVLLRAFQADDMTQSKLAQTIIRDHAPVFLNEIVLVEFAWVCRSLFKLDRAATARRLHAIVEAREFAFAQRDAIARAVADFTTRKSDFADCLIGALNLDHGCEATLTFDKGASKGEGFRRISERM